MKGEIKIKNKVLSYVNDSSYHKHAYFKTKPFNINLSEIQIIGIYRTLILDDEIDYFVFVDNNNNKNFIPISLDLETESFLSFLKYFNAEFYLNISTEWNDYASNNSFIIYPEHLKNRNLYKRLNFARRVILTIRKTLKISSIADGVLSDRVENYLRDK